MAGSLRCALLLAACAPLVRPADPTLLNMVMPEARILAGADLQAARTSPLGLFLLERARAQAEDPGFRKFIEATGFDPRQDLHEVLLASTGDPKQQKGLIVARGLFDTARILTLASQHGMPASTYRGALLFKLTHDAKKDAAGEPGALALLDGSIAVGGDAASVQAAIDRYRQGGAPLDTKLLARAMELSRRYELWSVSLVPATQWTNLRGQPAESQEKLASPLQGILETSGGVKLGRDVVIAGEVVARSDKDAAALSDVVRFLLGMMLMNAKDPQAVEAARLFQSLNLSVEGNVVKMSLRVPEADLEKMLLAAQSRPKAPARRTLRRSRVQ